LAVLAAAGAALADLVALAGVAFLAAGALASAGGAFAGGDLARDLAGAG
jgi:hypothetical protein